MKKLIDGCLLEYKVHEILIDIVATQKQMENPRSAVK